MFPHVAKQLHILLGRFVPGKILLHAALLQVLEFAEKHGLIVMVHSTGSPVKMAEIVKTLRKGDILSHAYHGGINNSMDDDFECLFEGKSRGVIIDAGMAGGVHTDFNVLKEAIKKGATPDTISTDITCHSAYKRGGRYGMTMCMSILKDMGMSEEEIFKAVTRKPALVLGKENMWGSLKEGKNADVEPPHRHSRMIQRKHKRAEQISKASALFFFKTNKRKSAEEKFFKEGIDEGDIKRYVNKIIRAYSRTLAKA